MPFYYYIQASLWSDAGLITIDISSHNNGIALCPTCHYQFDLVTDPGFVLIPTDLDFFISFELEDRERRAKEGENPRRQVPNHETYKAHQMAKGDITVEACGGLYYPIFLKEYFHQRSILSTFVLQLLEQLSKPKPWHGDPVAVLRRCFPILGSMRSKNLSVESRKKLEELRNLYFYDNEEEGRNQPHPTPTQSNAVESNKKRHLDDTSSSSHPPTPKRPRNNGREGGQIEFCPVTLSYQWFSWDLGPQVTTEEVVRRYAPLIRGPS